jgi:Bifunctional DNA primase/polymerase, N-terminal
MKHMVFEYPRRWQLLPMVYATKRAALPFHCASNDADTIRRWYGPHGRYRTANVAVMCGRVSGVIGIDVENAEGEAELKRLGMPLGPRCNSGGTRGGFHIYVTYPEQAGPLRGQVTVAPGLELRGNNHLLMLPPSIHPKSQQPYWWAPGYEPWKFVVLPEAPQWVIDALIKPERELYRPPAGPLDDRYVAKALQNELDGLEAVPEGTRNHTLFRVACKLFRFGQEHAPLIAQELMDKALYIGLSEYESKGTLQSAARAQGVRLP